VIIQSQAKGLEKGLDMTAKAQATKLKKKNQLDFTKLHKTFVLQRKQTIKEVKRQRPEWEKICAHPVSAKDSYPE